MIRVAVTGAAGRMGRTLIEALTASEVLSLSAAFEHPQSSFIGNDAGEVAGVGKSSVVIGSDVSAMLSGFDVLIDFTIPEVTMANAEIVCAAGKNMVIGTTGFSDVQRQRLHQLSESGAIMQAANMSVGINLCHKLIAMAAQVLRDDVDIEIIEAHHRDKIDAPSGTALALGETLAQTLGRDLKQCAVYGREGRTGVRDRQTIGFETIRAGDIVGDHTVMFADEGERLEITHKASSRMTFAKGALRASAWIGEQGPGLYNMNDVLGISD